MPGNREHRLDTLRRLNEEAGDLHAYMDDEWRSLGYSHRLLRHDAEHPPEWAVKRYTAELAKAIMRCHVELDGYDPFEQRATLAADLNFDQFLVVISIGARASLTQVATRSLPA